MILYWKLSATLVRLPPLRLHLSAPSWCRMDHLLDGMHSLHALHPTLLQREITEYKSKPNCEWHFSFHFYSTNANAGDRKCKLMQISLRFKAQFL